MSIRIDNRGVIHDTVKFLGSGSIIVAPGAQIRHYSIIEMNNGSLVVGDRSVLGFYTMVQCTGEMIIGSDTLIGPHCSFFASYHPESYHPDEQKKLVRSFIRIGDNVWSGANAVFNHGIEIGNDVIIGANSFVSDSFSSGVIIAGTPARIIRAKQEKVKI